MWSPLGENIEGPKDLVRAEVRGLLVVLKYVAIWAGAFVLIGRSAEIVFGSERTRAAVLVTLVAATAITYLASKRF